MSVQADNLYRKLCCVIHLLVAAYRLASSGVARMRIGKLGIAITGVVLACAGLLLPANAATIELTDGQSFEAAAESLGPGDILIVHAGTYFDSGRIAITVKGTPEAPVVIQGAPGEA